MSTKRLKTGRSIGPGQRAQPRFGRLRQADAGGEVSREEFEAWARRDVLDGRPTSPAHAIYQRLCRDVLLPEERLELSLITDKLRLRQAERAEYDQVVDRIRERVYGAGKEGSA